MSKRTREDVEADTKKCRKEIANFEDQQFDSQDFRGDVDDDAFELKSVVGNWSHFMQKQQGGMSVLEDVQQTDKYLYGQNDLILEDSLSNINAQIDSLNEKIDDFGAEMKAMSENKE